MTSGGHPQLGSADKNNKVISKTPYAGPFRETRTEMGKTRGFLYKLARLLGDVNAVNKGKVGRRLGRRVAGKTTGKMFRKLFK